MDDRITNLIILVLILILLLIFIRIIKDNTINKTININMNKSINDKTNKFKNEDYNIVEGFMDNNDEILDKILNNIFCINLERSKERLKKIKEKARNENININFYKAVDGNKLKNTDIKKLCTDNYYKEIMRNSKYGNIGCYLSHLNLWKKINNENIDYALIIEDDIVFCKNFKNELLKSLKTIPNNWDIIFLGLTRPCGKQINNNIYSILEKKCDKNNGGLFAYIVNGKNIKKMIRFCDVKIDKMIDHKIRDNYLNMDTFFVYPFIISHNYDFESDRNGNKYSNRYIKKANILNN